MRKPKISSVHGLNVSVKMVDAHFHIQESPRVSYNMSATLTPLTPSSTSHCIEIVSSFHRRSIVRQFTDKI